MGICRDIKTEAQQLPRKGGTRAALFVYAVAGIDTMAFTSIGVSLVTYFYGYMNFSLTKSATTVTNFMGTAFLLSLFGAFLSDTYFSRFKTYVLFGSIQVLGYALLAVQAHFSQLRPFPCKNVPLSQSNQCESADIGQLAILYGGIYLIALGNSGVKAALPSLGADQFDEKDPKEAAKLSSYFNWLLFFITVGVMLGVTFLVWISDSQGWDWSFGVCCIAVGLAILLLTMGKPFYRNNIPKGSPLMRITQVFVAAFRNRNLPLPQNKEDLHQIKSREPENGTEILQRTDQFKFLDRAAILRTKQEASTSSAHGQWSLCTISQVEETKIVVRMLPIILSTVFMNTCMAQLQTFTIQQSLTMNRKIRNFEIPGPSITVIPQLFQLFLIPVYDRIFVPIARKLTEIPSGIRQLQRIGVGLVITAVSMAVAAVVESHRKSVAIEHNMVDSASPLPMSVFWLGYQYVIFATAEIFTLVGLLDFFYAESTSGMKSLSMAISWSSLAFGYFTSSLVVSVINKVSGGWLANNNLNRDKLDYFYWLLAGVSVLNFGFYLLCASWYKYKKLELNREDATSDKKAKGKMETCGV
ncbi:protein NRT1/ PTR FAMILY 4.5-like [Nicotiana tabacum]|uniref:Protein NRT1/ PTR FAMILY 4.5-like n=2 Tax=Nicotiana TaxID=4085 RepID=A0A1S4B692_TOBAC|nr:PREDICTED: protein NRT1/ PTR FAMILY 4.5-like [Nicotiana sylvestris]XP_016484384.1 PREDICTED: protein NRT1/ PTR FAMILY 4.5-like [Nicotiana tabacum]